MVRNVGKLGVQEREFFNEFVHGTTPVPPNYLEQFVVGGNETMVIYHVDKLLHTFEAVSQSVVVSDFVIDEASLSKIIDACHGVKKLKIENCKINIKSLLTLEENGETWSKLNIENSLLSNVRIPFS